MPIINLTTNEYKTLKTILSKTKSTPLKKAAQDLVAGFSVRGVYPFSNREFDSLVYMYDLFGDPLDKRVQKKWLEELDQIVPRKKIANKVISNHKIASQIFALVIAFDYLHNVFWEKVRSQPSTKRRQLQDWNFYWHWKEGKQLPKLFPKLEGEEFQPGIYHFEKWYKILSRRHT